MCASSASVRSYPDAQAVAEAAADQISAIIHAAVAARGRCAVALSGGSTPARYLQLLAQRGAAALPWSQIDLWWGDERTVPPEHPDSNYRMVRTALLAPLGADAPRVHRMLGEHDDKRRAASSYQQELLSALDEPPVFDLVLLGMGSDGHTASLFPRSPAVTPPLTDGSGPPETRWVIANPVDSPLTHGATMRLTLTAHAINAARHVLFVVTGSDKASALAAVLEGPADPQRYPSQLIAPRGELTWLVDAAAAAQLRGTP